MTKVDNVQQDIINLIACNSVGLISHMQVILCYTTSMTITVTKCIADKRYYRREILLVLSCKYKGIMGDYI